MASLGRGVFSTEGWRGAAASWSLFVAAPIEWNRWLGGEGTWRGGEEACGGRGLRNSGFQAPSLPGEAPLLFQERGGQAGAAP